MNPIFVNRLCVCVCVGSIDLEMESDFFESVWIVAGRGGLWWLWGRGSAGLEFWVNLWV